MFNYFDNLIIELHILSIIINITTVFAQIVLRESVFTIVVYRTWKNVLQLGLSAQAVYFRLLKYFYSLNCVRICPKSLRTVIIAQE